MKIFLIADYFYPYNPGGTEWSVYELAKAFKKSSIDSTVITLNYGSKQEEIYHGIKIIRLPFFKKLKDKRAVVNPIWQNNLLFFLTSAYYLFKIIKSENPEIIHVHGKFLIPAAIISGFISKKPVIVTIRDKQIICPIGKCFFDQKRFKSCNFWEFLISDFPWFIKNYTNKKPFVIAHIFIGVIWSRFAGEIIKFFAKRAIQITTISNSQKKYLEANGFKNVKVIYNTADFKISKVIIPKIKSVLFVGKLSKGKGVELLLDAAESLLKNNKIKFLFAGQVQSLKIKNRLKQKPLKSSSTLLGSVDYNDLPGIYRKVSVLAMPSIYPESFGRAALESLSNGTPVVVTDVGALSEIVEDKITGRVVPTAMDSLKEAILDVLKNEKQYKKNIAKNYEKLRDKFNTNPIYDYVKLYKEYTK